MPYEPISCSPWLVSFSLICESIAAQFLTFVPQGEQTLAEKDSLFLRTTKSSFFSRSANFGNVFSFSDGRNKHIFQAYPSTLKIAELCIEITAAHSTIIRSAWLFRLSFYFEEQVQALLVYCHFHSFLILHYIYYISQRNNTKNYFRITGYSVKTRSQVRTTTRAILREISHRVYQFHEEGGVVSRFLTVR